ncbi:PD40 domain-containing protein, partial [candidate division KSB1 bacterium]|nr:PD40 domain-containing protein [candidate division KSB1 bacterium]
MHRILVSSFMILLFCIPLSAQETHPFSVHDMLAMDRISDAQVSPDGKTLVFTLRKTDLDANKGKTDIWLVDAGGEHLRQLTTHAAADFNPRWSFCGKYVWFLSTRSGSSQVWRISIHGGEAQQMTRLPLDVNNLMVSPYGGYIAFTMEVFVDLKSVEKTREKLDEIAGRKASGVIYDRLFFRHWDTWKDGRRSHLFVMPVKDGVPVDVMVDMDADTPSKPFGGTEEIAFAPNGLGIVFTARDVGREEAWSTDFDLYYAPLDGSQPPKCLTEANEAWDTQPVFSPDGRTMAYLAMSRPRYEADRFRIVLHSWADGAKRVLTESWDRSPSSFCWSADGETIFATAANVGQSSLFAVDVSSGGVR